MKKILSLVLVLAMALCLFAGCASKEGDTSDKLTMATNAEFPKSIPLKLLPMLTRLKLLRQSQRNLVKNWKSQTSTLMQL